MNPISRRLLPVLAVKALAAAALLTTLPTWAGEASAIGLWENVDDASGKPRALI